MITFLLPPEFTGQERAIGLQGEAVVTRVDPERQGIGVEFVKTFRQFEQVSVPDVTEKAGEDSVASHLSRLGGVLERDFVARHPYGFLVEYSRRVFDRDVILQLDTHQMAGKEPLEQKEISRRELVAARVFELKKSSLGGDPAKITVGRASTNDLVFQNRLVSRQHGFFELRPSSQTCFLVDMESTNGTFVNTRRLEPNDPYQLSAGDEILFGYEVRVVYFPSHAFFEFLGQLTASEPQ